MVLQNAWRGHQVTRISSRGTKQHAMRPGRALHYRPPLLPSCLAWTRAWNWMLGVFNARLPYYVKLLKDICHRAFKYQGLPRYSSIKASPTVPTRPLLRGNDTIRMGTNLRIALIARRTHHLTFTTSRGCAAISPSKDRTCSVTSLPTQTLGALQIRTSSFCKH